MEWTRSGMSCNSIWIHVNKYNSIQWSQQKRNEYNPDWNSIRIHVNTPNITKYMSVHELERTLKVQKMAFPNVKKSKIFWSIPPDPRKLLTPSAVIWTLAHCCRSICRYTVWGLPLLNIHDYRRYIIHGKFVLGCWKLHSTIGCQQYCTWLSTILNNIVEPELAHNQV